MKIVLLTLNSKYIHSSLASWYLKEFVKELLVDITVIECTINDTFEFIMSSIYDQVPDIIAISCYIWNIEQVLKISKEIKRVNPACEIILGGPEVSFDTEELMRSNNCIDFVIVGEGEETFFKLLQNKIRGISCHDENLGLSFRRDDEIRNGKYQIVENLSKLPSPYSEEMLKTLDNKLVYIETSRGCPFACSYCLSSTTKGVRTFTLERVFKDIQKLIDTGAKVIKFTDRTFNFDVRRAIAIFEFVISTGYGCTFHFEIGGDLFSHEEMEILKTAPPGRIQFEIGIQTMNDKTLSEIKRPTDITLLSRNIIEIIKWGNIHVHIDLIAGLPYEDKVSFINSFNNTYGFGAHHFQLGFLKLLKGTHIRDHGDVHQYQYREWPPYEITSNIFMSAFDLIELKGIEDVLEKVYNTGRFKRTLQYVIPHFFASPYTFYDNFYIFLRQSGLGLRPISSRLLFEKLREFCLDLDNLDLLFLENCLRYDFLLAENPQNMPDSLKVSLDIGLKNHCIEFLRKEENIKQYFPHFIGVSVKNMLKKLYFVQLDEKFIIDYTFRDIVTGLFKAVRLK